MLRGTNTHVSEIAFPSVTWNSPQKVCGSHYPLTLAMSSLCLVTTVNYFLLRRECASFGSHSHKVMGYNSIRAQEKSAELCHVYLAWCRFLGGRRTRPTGNCTLKKTTPLVIKLYGIIAAVVGLFNVHKKLDTGLIRLFWFKNNKSHNESILYPRWLYFLFCVLPWYIPLRYVEIKFLSFFHSFIEADWIIIKHSRSTQIWANLMHFIFKYTYT